VNAVMNLRVPLNVDNLRLVKALLAFREGHCCVQLLSYLVGQLVIIMHLTENRNYAL
jgi:hypothetical protein